MRTKGHGTEQISMYTCGPTVDHSRFIFSHKKRSNRLAQGQTSHPHSPANQEQRQEEELQHCEVRRMEVGGWGCGEQRKRLEEERKKGPNVTTCFPPPTLRSGSTWILRLITATCQGLNTTCYSSECQMTGFSLSLSFSHSLSLTHTHMRACTQTACNKKQLDLLGCAAGQTGPFITL